MKWSKWALKGSRTRVGLCDLTLYTDRRVYLGEILQVEPSKWVVFLQGEGAACSGRAREARTSHFLSSHPGSALKNFKSGGQHSKDTLHRVNRLCEEKYLHLRVAPVFNTKESLHLKSKKHITYIKYVWVYRITYSNIFYIILILASRIKQRPSDYILSYITARNALATRVCPQLRLWNTNYL